MINNVQTSTKQVPKFSIVIPLVELNQHVHKCVDHIQGMLEKDWELIILPDRTTKAPWNDKRITTWPTGRVSPGAKRDIGAQNTSGEFIIFLDDDSFPQSDYLNVLASLFEDPNIHAVGGPGVDPEGCGFFEKVSGAVYSTEAWGGIAERYLSKPSNKQFDDWPSVNFSLRRALFESIGGFDTNYWPGEDTILCQKIKLEGYKITYCPDLVVSHHRRPTVLKHIKQCGAYGLHRGFFARVRPENSRHLRFFVPSLALLTFCFSIIFSFIWHEFFLLTLVGISFYSIALTVGFFKVCRRQSIGVAVCALPLASLTQIVYALRFFQGFCSSQIASPFIELRSH